MGHKVRVVDSTMWMVVEGCTAEQSSQQSHKLDIYQDNHSHWRGMGSRDVVCRTVVTGVVVIRDFVTDSVAAG